MKTEEILELIFVKYWSQILLIISGFGGFVFYFSRLYFDRNSRLKELKSEILIKKNVDLLDSLNKSYCGISLLIEEILISKYIIKVSTDSNELDLLNHEIKNFLSLFMQTVLLSNKYKHDKFHIDFEFCFTSYTKLFHEIYKDENQYKENKLKLQFSKQVLDVKFNEMLIIFLK